MCRKEGMGIAPWGVINQGKWQSKAQIEARKASGEQFRRGQDELDEKDAKMSEQLIKIAIEIGGGATVTSVAIAWCLLKEPFVSPISKSGCFRSMRGRCGCPPSDSEACHRVLVCSGCGADRRVRRGRSKEQRIQQPIMRVVFGEAPESFHIEPLLTEGKQRAALIQPVGGRKIEHLTNNLNALSHDLTQEQIKTLEEIYPFDVGFSMNRFGMDSNVTGKTENMLVKASAQVQWVKNVQAIRPGQGV